MKKLNKIKEPVKNELKQFNEFFDNTLKSEHTLIKFITNFILRRKGKQIRPLFVLLIAKLNGTITEKTYVGATLIELLHSATLIHDDIVDNSELRRGFFALKSIWGNKIAVLIGDYLLSKGLTISLEYNAEDLLRIVAQAVKEMAEGELLQAKKSRLMNFDEEDYYEIIRKKTAMLISASAAIGAKSVGADQEIVKKMKDFGTYIGMAFQIKDDLLDIQENAKTGKSFGNDIRDKKITLPLIKSIQNATKKDKRLIIKTLNKKNKTQKDIQQIINFIDKYNGLEYANKKILEFKDKAVQILKNYPDSQIKKALFDFIEFNINRTK